MLDKTLRSEPVRVKEQQIVKPIYYASVCYYGGVYNLVLLTHVWLSLHGGFFM